MDRIEFLAYLKRGNAVEGGSPQHMLIHEISDEARRITGELNGSYHTADETRAFLTRLTGRPVDQSVTVFLPFYSDFGKNIVFGKNVFVNAGCHFQDQGGVTIGDGALIGHNVVFATINHAMAPSRRSSMTFAPIAVGKNVWIGSHATILPGVTIGDGAVIGAGAVVTRDVPENAVAAGVPARLLRYLTKEELEL